MTALQTIESYYGTRCTTRSKTKLINHIYEGLEILSSIGASNIVKDAYCIHPILQSDEDFINHYTSNFSGIPTESLLLAMEYRRVANSYLSKNKMSDFVGLTLEEIRQMLIADKVQNYKDFLLYHQGSHPRSKQLDEYFNHWFDLLDINYDNVVKALLRTASILRITNENGKILLLDRSDKTGYGFPGGKVDYKERADTAAIRETFEETGIRITNIEKHLDFISRVEGRESFQVIVFDCKGTVPADIEVKINEAEHLDYGWFSNDFLPEKLSGNTPNILKEFFAYDLLSQV